MQLFLFIVVLHDIIFNLNLTQLLNFFFSYFTIVHEKGIGLVKALWLICMSITLRCLKRLKQ